MVIECSEIIMDTVLSRLESIALLVALAVAIVAFAIYHHRKTK